MAPLPTLTAAQARLLHLAAQGLLTPPTGVAAGPSLLGDVARALTISARWHGTPESRLGRRVAPALKAALGPRLATAERVP